LRHLFIDQVFGTLRELVKPLNQNIMTSLKYLFSSIGCCFVFFVLSCSNDNEPEPSIHIPVDSIANLASDTLSVSELTFNPVSFSEGIWIKKYPGNYTSFKIETSSGFKIITDPYNTDSVKPDIVTLSHRHFDHCDMSKLMGNYTIIENDEMYNLNGISIEGYRGNHNKGASDSINCVFIFNIEGIKIGQFGSLGEMLTDDIGKLDVLIILVSKSTAKLTLDEIEIIIRNTGAKIIIPAHGTPNLGEALAAKIGADYWLINTGDIIVTKNNIAKIKKPLVLNLDHSF
jgi:hypothetical protein